MTQFFAALVGKVRGVPVTKDDPPVLTLAELAAILDEADQTDELFSGFFRVAEFE